MKKTLWLALFLVLVCVFALSACNSETAEPTIAISDDGYVVVNDVKTEHKVYTEPAISVIDGYVAVNGIKTEYEVNAADTITIEDGYLVVNGVKTEHEVKNKNHSYGEWKLYNDNETNCEKKLYYRTCPDCSNIEWKEGKYTDHNFTTVTTLATCQSGGYDTKTCTNCGQVEICNETPVSVSNHSFGDWYIKSNATCSTNGLEERTCVCGKSETKTIPAIGTEHVPVTDVAVEPTYTSTGLTEGSHCSVCNTTLVEQRTISKIWNGTSTKPTKMVNINGVYYYEISTAEEFAYIGELANNTNYILTCDIAMNWNVLDEDKSLTNEELNSWSPKFASIGGDGYSGTFNGNGHCIYGIYISGSDRYCGIFGRVFGEIVNLNIKDSYIKGGSCTGGICGILNGTMKNCTFDGYVCGSGNYVGYTPDGGTGGLCGSGSDIWDCTNFGMVEGSSIVGGIAGVSDYIKNCVNYGQIYGSKSVGGICGLIDFWNGVDSCTNYGFVNGESEVGGIVGRTTGNSSSNCINSNNYASVSGSTYIGGIVGHQLNGDIINCNNYANVNGTTYVGGIAGYAKRTISKCYNQGDVEGDSSIGGVAGEADIFFGNAKISETYYLKNESINNDINGIGNASDTDSGCAKVDTPKEDYQ